MEPRQKQALLSVWIALSAVFGTVFVTWLAVNSIPQSGIGNDRARIVDLNQVPERPVSAPAKTPALVTKADPPVKKPPTVAKPTKPAPVEKKPAESKPVENKPVAKEPVKMAPVQRAEPQPAESKPAEPRQTPGPVAKNEPAPAKPAQPAKTDPKLALKKPRENANPAPVRKEEPRAKPESKPKEAPKPAAPNLRDKPSGVPMRMAPVPAPPKDKAKDKSDVMMPIPVEPEPRIAPNRPEPTPLLSPRPNSLPAYSPVEVTFPRPMGLVPAPFGYAQIWNGNRDEKLVCFTFDDGPHPSFTPRLLKLLREQDVKVTFFFIGRNVDICPDIARAALADGHELANHTYDHIRLTGVPPAVIERELTEGAASIERATGVWPIVFRTPGGGYSQEVLSVAQRLGMTMAQWSSNAMDATQANGENPSPDRIYRNVMSTMKPGSIVLLHEPSKGSLEALPRIIRDLRAQGYRFVTLKEMMERHGNEITTWEEARSRGDFSPRDYVLSKDG
jgi:peptidoglycan/xylan/chitin deacetylase (PgdA/CDA1 family)